MTRSDVLATAIENCIKEIYTLVVPRVSWKDFVEENKIYSDKRKNSDKIIDPAPYEFYYLPKEIMNDICQSYIDAYKLDSQQNLLDIIEILKQYCKAPIIDKYIPKKVEEDGFVHPGYRDYEHPDNLEKELIELFNPLEDCDGVEMATEVQNKFFKFLDMAGNFYTWNRDLNTFNCSVYLGPSPNSNKDAVIENWKKYRNKDIEIDEEQIKKEYYGEELD